MYIFKPTLVFFLLISGMSTTFAVESSDPLVLAAIQIGITPTVIAAGNTRTVAVGGASTATITNSDGTTASATCVAGNCVGDPSAINAAKVDDGSIRTITSEMVPGATCNCITKGAESNGACANTVSVPDRKYECTVSPGLAGFQSVFAKLIRYVINIVLLLGVLAVVGLGIAWSFAGGDDVKMKTTLKTWGINIIVGLVILFMFPYILQFVAPYVYK